MALYVRLPALCFSWGEGSCHQWSATTGEIIEHVSGTKDRVCRDYEPATRTLVTHNGRLHRAEALPSGYVFLMFSEGILKVYRGAEQITQLASATNSLVVLKDCVSVTTGGSLVLYYPEAEYGALRQKVLSQHHAYFYHQLVPGVYLISARSITNQERYQVVDCEGKVLSSPPVIQCMLSAEISQSPDTLYVSASLLHLWSPATGEDRVLLRLPSSEYQQPLWLSDDWSLLRGFLGNDHLLVGRRTGRTVSLDNEMKFLYSFREGGELRLVFWRGERMEIVSTEGETLRTSQPYKHKPTVFLTGGKRLEYLHDVLHVKDERDFLDAEVVACPFEAYSSHSGDLTRISAASSGREAAQLTEGFFRDLLMKDLRGLLVKYL